MIRQIITLVVTLGLTACGTTPPPFDLEAWKANQLARLQPHELDIETTIAARPVNEADLGTTLEEMVSFLAPDLDERVVGYRRGVGSVMDNSTFIRLDEAPSRIGSGVCRALGHYFRSSGIASRDGTMLDFRSRKSEVRFFASDDAGHCQYERDRTTFWTNKDEDAVEFLETARAAQARLAADRLQIRCDESLPGCETVARNGFDISRINQARPCSFEPDCTEFGFSTGRFSVEVHGNQNPRVMIVSALPAPLLE